MCASLAHGQAVHPYAPQPVHRVIDPLMRMILQEMDLTLKSVTPVINTTVTVGSGGSYGASFSDASFYLYDNADANKKGQFQLSGVSTLTTRTLTWPNTNGTIALLEQIVPFTRGQTIQPDRDETALLLDGVNMSSGYLLQVNPGGSSTCLAITAGGTVLTNNFAMTNGDIGTGPIATLNTGNLVTTDKDYAFPNASGMFSIVNTGTAVAARVPFYTGSVGAGGDLRLTADGDMTFAADSLVITKVRIPTSLRLGSNAGISDLNAGTWTPTRSAEVNLDANVTTFEGQWMRTGNTVTCSGRFTVDPTAAGATSFEFTLPVASNFGAVEDAAGVAFCSAAPGEGVQISGSVANNTLVFAWVTTITAAQSFSFTATYQVI